MRISDWSSDVCSSDLVEPPGELPDARDRQIMRDREALDETRAAAILGHQGDARGHPVAHVAVADLGARDSDDARRIVAADHERFDEFGTALAEPAGNPDELARAQRPARKGHVEAKGVAGRN